MTLILPQIGGSFSEFVDVLGLGITGLETWHDATDLSTLFTDSAKTTAVTTTGDRVGCWVDKSGNGFDFTQTTAGLRPIYDTTTMTQESLSFTGSSGGREWLYNATDKQTFMVFVVVEVSGTNSNVLFGFDAADNRYAYYEVGATTYSTGSDTGYTTVGGGYAGLVPRNDPHILTIDCRNYINMDFTEYLMAFQQQTAGTPAGTYVGRRHNLPNNEAPFTGNVVELLTYNRKLTATEVADVEDYLNTKHSIGLTR
tara:strand:- start:4315 stop:5079 length:765 start_codon:yes stop_codon:yes gene_type:complete